MVGLNVGAFRSFSTTRSANDVARMTLVGRLGQDIEKMTSANGREYARYAVAVRTGRETETSWFHVVCFDSNLDYLTNFKKGSLIYVEAHASLQPFETAEGRRVGSLQLVQRSITRLVSPRPKEDAEPVEATA
ncbi:hypothetical protein V1511DRAFT_521124 [Dipodascopsis uninucleata]